MTSDRWETLEEIATRTGLRPEKVVAAVAEEHRQRKNVCAFDTRDGEKITVWRRK